MSLDISHEVLAPKNLRLANYIIDSLAIIALYIFLMIGVGFFSVLFGTSTAWIDEAEEWKFTVFVYLLMLVYYMVFVAFGGRTLGKLITGTMVITKDGEKPEFQQIVGRTLCRFIPFDPLSFAGELGWHDSISGTRVVRKHIYIKRKNEVVELDEIGQNSDVF